MLEGGKTSCASPTSMLIVTGAVILATEGIIMLLLGDFLDGLKSTVIAALVDTTLLATVCTPILYVALYRPLRRQLDALHRKEREEHALLDSIPNLVWFLDGSLRIAWANRAFEEETGWKMDTLRGKAAVDIWGEAETRWFKADNHQAMQTRQTVQKEYELTMGSGQRGHYVISRTPVFDEAGQPSGIVCVAHDITTATEMQDLLQATLRELEYQKVALDEHAIVSVADAKGVIKYVNDKFCQISQYDRAELHGRTHAILNSGRHPREFFVDMWTTIASGKAWHGEIRNRRKNGSHYWVETTIVPFLDKAGRPYQYVSIRTDITAFKGVEAELREATELLEQRVEARTEELERAKKELESDIAERQRAERQLRESNAELTAINRKLEDAQNQLLQSEKMASVGQLAAGVAHEINNPIGYVYSNLGTLGGYVEDLLHVLDAYEAVEPEIADEATRGSLHRVKKEADLAFLREDLVALMGESREGIERVKKIVQDLKDFSRVDASDEWQVVDLHKGLDSTLNIVWNELKYKAEVRKEYGELPEVECLPSQLNQVFLNMLVNAGHAIKEKGTITLRTGCQGEQVWVEIADDGHGIAPEHLQRIFDPFFTTKPVGKGTGLGLSLSYSIVKKHGGHIEVRSTPGVGTAFRINLPMHHVAVDAKDDGPTVQATEAT